MLGEEVLYLPVRELGKRLRAKEISAVELTESYLARSEQLNPRLNAYVTITRELAVAQARAAEREIVAGRYRGPLHGIPYAAKDSLAVKGYPTTWGAKLFANQRFDFNATVVDKLEDAGAILIGKAAMIELAGTLGYRYPSATLTGATKNPWDQGCWTCGSSSGSAAIVAGGLAAFALGTESWGSIICPSAFCGVTGLRPTFGRVSRQGAMMAGYSLDKIGPLGRTADDCALVLAAIAGHDSYDRSSLSPGDADFSYTTPITGRLRIGLLTNAWQKPDPEIEAAAKSALDALEATGAAVKEARLPEGPYVAAADTIVYVEGAAAFRDLIDSGKVAGLTDGFGQIAGYVNEQISASDYMRALQIRGVFQPRIDALFDEFDVITAPSMPVAATTVDEDLADLSFADPVGAIGNLCGLPAVSVPCGFTSKGLPIGIQFLARVCNEHAVILAATRLQNRTDWHKKQPPLSQASANAGTRPTRLERFEAVRVSLAHHSRV
jgi:aspartyl-tRNA(Asn)/glutamyl-tRNA(Gln) amidotransferase subunit A